MDGFWCAACALSTRKVAGNRQRVVCARFSLLWIYQRWAFFLDFFVGLLVDVCLVDLSESTGVACKKEEAAPVAATAAPGAAAASAAAAGTVTLNTLFHSLTVLSTPSKWNSVHHVRTCLSQAAHLEGRPSCSLSNLQVQSNKL